MHDLQPAAQRPSVFEFDHKLKHIADLHKQTALNPNTGFSDIQNFARR
jgi:hypothetical protein